MRKAFSMITAIFVILIMASVAILILNISSKTVKSTTIQFKQEQAALYAKSYTELAILYATANDAETGTTCAENINGVIGSNANTGDGYRVQTRIAYIGHNLTNPPCSTSRILYSGPLATPAELHMIIDVYVQYRDPDVIAAFGTEVGVPWITYHRRTLQKL